jgi:hypothetical protein
MLIVCGLISSSLPAQSGCFQVGSNLITVSGQTICLTGAAPAPNSFTDSSGNVWSVNAAAQVVVNGVADTSTSAVVKLAYVVSTTTPPAIVQKNSAGGYWTKSTPGGAWVGTTTPF